VNLICKEVFSVERKTGSPYDFRVAVPLFVDHSTPLIVAVPLFVLFVSIVSGVFLVIRHLGRGNGRAALVVAGFVAWSAAVAVAVWSIANTLELEDSGAMEADALGIVMLLVVWLLVSLGGLFVLRYFRSDHRPI
jgi:hypothetical protein